MNCNHSLRLRCNGAAHLGKVKVEGPCVNIDKDRCRTHIGNGLGGCNKGERRGDHLVARPNAQGSKRQVQGIGPRGAANDMGNCQTLADLLFKLLNVGPKNKLRCIKGIKHSLINIGL